MFCSVKFFYASYEKYQKLRSHHQTQKLCVDISRLIKKCIMYTRIYGKYTNVRIITQHTLSKNLFKHYFVKSMQLLLLIN